MAEAKQTIASAAAVSAAEKFKPNWKVVPAVQATGAVIQAEASTPELSAIRQKYFAGDVAHAAVPAGLASSELVTMEPVNEATTRAGRKVVVVQNGEIIGEQG